MALVQHFVLNAQVGYDQSTEHNVSLLLLLGNQKFNPRTLFSNNEQGLWLDPSDMTAGKAAWRRNLLLNTEPANSTGYSFATDISFVTESAFSFLPSAGRAAGYGDASVNRRLQFNFTSFVTGQSYTFSFYIYLDGGVEPNQGAGSYRDFTITRDGQDVTNYANITYDNTGGGVYRVKHTWTHTGTGNSLTVWKYGGLSTNTNFRASGFQLELGSTPTDYQPITDFSTEFKAAFPTHTLYQNFASDAVPCTAAGQPVSLILDQSRGGLANLGPEIVTNGGLSDATGWTVSGASPPSITGGQAVWSASTGEIQWASSLTVGKWYKLELDLVSYTSGSLSFRDGTTNTSIATTGTVAGRKTFLINATSTQIRFISFSSATLTLDNISIREVPGNHAYQVNAPTQCPTLARIPSSGRRNLLTFSEQFDVTTGGWTKTACTISANASTAPDGTSTADRITASAGTAYHYARQVPNLTGQYIYSVYVKRVNNDFIWLSMPSDAATLNRFNLATGEFTVTGAGVTATSTSVGNGWYKLSLSFNGTIAQVSVGIGGAAGAESFNAAGTEAVDVWGAQLETGSTATSYQKVVATTDVTESGVSDLWHLVFDGSDDSLVTNAVDFSATDEMTVIAGVRRTGSSGYQTILEASADWGANNGSFAMYAAENATEFSIKSKGTISKSASSSNLTSPTTQVASLQGDISAQVCALRLNAVDISSGSKSQGTGNYGNYQLFIGRRNNASLPFNGHIYQLIIRGRTTPTGKLLEAERYTARKAGTALDAPPSGGVSSKIAYHLVFYGAIRFEALEQDPELIISEVF